MAGPLAKLDTKMAGISLNISRNLYYGKGITMELMVPDPNEPDDFQVLATLTKGFDRITPDESNRGSGSEVIYHVADEQGTLGPVMRSTDLHVRVGDDVYAVDDVPPIAPNEAQVYILTCKTRTTRTKFFRR